MALALAQLLAFAGPALHLAPLALTCRAPPRGQALGGVFGLDTFGDAIDRLAGLEKKTHTLLKVFSDSLRVKAFLVDARIPY